MKPTKNQYFFEIPLHWTAEQANAIFELLHQLADAIFDAYENDMMKLIQNERAITMRQKPDEPDEIDYDNDESFPF